MADRAEPTNQPLRIWTGLTRNSRRSPAARSKQRRIPHRQEEFQRYSACVCRSGLRAASPWRIVPRATHRGFAPQAPRPGSGADRPAVRRSCWRSSCRARDRFEVESCSRYQTPSQRGHPRIQDLRGQDLRGPCGVSRCPTAASPAPRTWSRPRRAETPAAPAGRGGTRSWWGCR